MSRENVEIVRRVYDAAIAGDSATIYALYGHDVELDNTRMNLPERAGGLYSGHEGLRRFFRIWHEPWSEVEYDVEELLDAGADQVISVVTRRARGRASGAPVSMRVALIWTLRDHRVTRVVWFPTREEALAAARATDR